MKCNLDFWLQTDSLHDIDSTSMEAHDSREISIFIFCVMPQTNAARKLHINIFRMAKNQKMSRDHDRRLTFNE